MPKSTFLNLPADKRERVVEAAIEEFATVPFEAASVNRIVRRAGIAKGSFYQYFEGMTDLYRYLLLVVFAERKTSFILANPPPEGLGFFGQLAQATVSGIRWGMSEPRISAASRIMWYPLPAESPLRPFQDEMRELGHANTVLMLEAAREAGVVRADLDLGMAAAFLQSVLQQGVNGLMIQRVGFDLMTLCSRPELSAQVDVEAIADVAGTLVDLLQGGLGTGEDGGSIDIERIRQNVREWSQA